MFVNSGCSQIQSVFDGRINGVCYSELRCVVDGPGVTRVLLVPALPASPGAVLSGRRRRFGGLGNLSLSLTPS